LATVNVYKTWVYRVLLLASLIFIILNIVFLRLKLFKK